MKNDQSVLTGSSRMLQRFAPLLGFFALFLVSDLSALGWGTHVAVDENSVLADERLSDIPGPLTAKGSAKIVNYSEMPQIDRIDVFDLVLSTFRKSSFQRRFNRFSEKLDVVALLPNPATGFQMIAFPDVAISKNDGVASVNAGAITKYTVRIKNFDNNTLAAGAILTDPSQPGLNKLSLLPLPVPTPACTATPLNKCGSPGFPAPTIPLLEGPGYSLPALATGELFEFDVWAKVTASDPHVITTVENRAYVAIENIGSNFGGDEDTVIPVVDLVATKDDFVTLVNSGGSTTYTVSLTNNGPSVAYDSTISDPMAAGLTKTEPLGACSATGGAVCPVAGNGVGQLNKVNLEAGTVVVPALPVGGKISFTITANVTATSGSVTNTFSASAPAGTIEKTPVDNTASDKDDINVADLVVTKDDGLTLVNSGSPTTYTVTLMNSGPFAADGSIISDPSVAGLTKTSIGVCTPTGGAVCPIAGAGAGQLNIANLQAGTVVVPTLPVGGKISFTITADVTATSGTVTNTFSASVPVGTIDPTSSNNTASDTDTINVAELLVTKNDFVGEVKPGQSTIYAVTVTNLGPGSADNTTLSDPAVTGLMKTSIGLCAAIGGAVCPILGNGAGELSIPNLEAGTVLVPTFPAGGKISFDITAKVTAPPNTSVTNTFSAKPPLGLESGAFDIDAVGAVVAGPITVCKTIPANDPMSTATPFVFLVKDSIGQTKTISITGSVGSTKCVENITPDTIPAPTPTPIPQFEAGDITFTEVSGVSNTQVTAITAFLDQIPPASPTPLPTPAISLTQRSVTVTIPQAPALMSRVTFTNATAGAIEVCKQLAPGDPIPVNTLFTFSVTGAIDPAQSTVTVPAGAFGSPNCSPPIFVAVGDQTVTETLRANTIVNAIDVDPVSRLVSKNLPNRTVTVTVPQGGVSNQTLVTFTNQTTRTGTLEICKDAADTDVTGTFNFTVEGAPGQAFSVPVGFCSSPITVTIPQVGNAPFTARVTELASPNYRLVDVITAPMNALGPITFDAGFDANGAPLANNTNGGYVVVNLTVGGISNQKIVRFINRTLPGKIKVCKITADPVNIPIGTEFTFTISGMAGPLPGTGSTVSFPVLAGPAAQGGFCSFAPGTWVVGQPLFVGENGISAANTTVLPLGFAATQAALRVSAITATSPFLPAPVSGFNFGIPVNPDFITPIAGYKGYGAINARKFEAVMTFTNFVYRPAVLKLCKTSSTIAVNTPFTFTIAPADPTTTWPYPVGPITVPVGSCTFVNGPFPQNLDFGEVNPFNYGTSIIVTETAVSGVSVSSITSPTLLGSAPVGSLTADLPNRKGTLTLNQPMLPSFSFNELSFDNSNSSGVDLRRARFDFDGDRSSDIALFRPSDGNWYYMASSTASARTVHFGQAGDIPVAADFDGDGKTDPAVYRNGIWYVLGSTAGFSAMNFGLPSDIPQAGDFDGDRKADFAVFRPSNGTWYIMGSSSGFKAVQFGTLNDKPTAADFDGDGKLDPAVFRPSSGTWYILGSTSGFSGIQFGTNGDIPVQADYDGDGKTDVAVFRPVSGTWYIMTSSQGFRAAQFGTSGDSPVPADYDGDGKTDIGVYRPTTAVWYLMYSSQSGNAVGGFNALQFGALGDVLMRY